MRLDLVSLLSERERHRIVVEWNATERTYAPDACVHELFEAQAVSSPEAPAVEDETTCLSYGELNARANRLARYLRARGVAPDARVAICMERSVELIVALLGVLKAGGAYVPLDPSYPLERLSYVLRDAAPALLLTHDAIAQPVRAALASSGVAGVDVVADASHWSQEPAENLDGAGLDASHLAYVIYTSGSTGTPKGAMNEHRGIVNRLRWGQETYPLTRADAVLQKTPVSFDISVWELFWPLTAGARLVMARPGGHKDPEYLIEAIGRHGITTMHFVPSMLRLFLEHSAIAVPGLRRVICSGEALPKALVDRFHERVPGVALSNLYGPTEAAVEVTSWECAPGEVPENVPIGRPIANTRTYVLDSRLEPVPAGVSGELHIGGVQVARGYWNRPELTAERFIANPFVAGDRLYKTGDVARYRADGSIEYLGRNDDQVKIRGFRIELGEIEARLGAYPGIRDAVVAALDDGAGDKRLVAYYTGGDAEIGADLLRAHLSSALPEYMVPAAYVALESLPLLPNGKLDRKALPSPDGGSYAQRVYEEPSGEIETSVASMWSELLKVDRVGRNDNFFELGGHSLLAMRVLSRVRQALQIEASLAKLFAHPTLSGFAAALADAKRTVLPAVVRSERGDRIPLSYAQERLWFLAQLDPAASRAYHIPFGLPLPAATDVRALRRALNGMVARHETLRTTFSAIDGEPVQRIGPADRGFALTEHDLHGSADADAEFKRISSEVHGAPFDLESGPLIRGALVCLASGEYMLLVVTHHIATDGWSSGVFMRELRTLYDAYCAGRENPLTPLAVQYADYAIWQRSLMAQDALAEQASYWKRTLAGAPALLELPADRPRPALQDHRGARHAFTLDAQLTGQLKALSRRHGATPFMTLLTAWGALLSRLSGQDDVVVGTAVANRARPEIEPLIGFFVNTLALRLDYSGTASLGESIERVKAQAIAGQEHQDLPFEQVVELVNPPRTLSHTPLFQTMLTWQTAEGGERGEPQSRAKASAPKGAAPPPAAKFDVMLELSERGDEISGAIVYATALFDRATIERYDEYLRRILEAMVADDRQTASHVALLSEQERRRIVGEWNATERPYPPDECVHELFEARVASSPQAVAVEDEATQLSYAELNARANRLARYLRARGVGPDARVAICLERSVGLVAAMLGVLKAGGAYVPLDPSYPLERLSYVLQDAAPSLVLTHDAIGEPVRAALASTGVSILDVVADESHWSQEPAGNLERAGLEASHLAYAIYTSGSTGTPKGVAVEHRSLVNLVRWSAEFCAIGESDALLQKTPIGFDASVWEFFWPLASGARLVMARPGGHRDPGYLTSVIREKNVTVLQVVPSLLRALSEDADLAECAGLRALFSGGEALSEELVRRVRALLPNLAIYNVYGPTEATVDCAAWTCARDAGENVPIGRPIANTRTYVLDKRLEPVPAGVAGELYIGGVQVARGYWNRPELTAERFIASPFVAGDRLYRTGDVARHRADGAIEYLGRNDDQVKIRGFRIELGEIEARLSAYPGIRDAAVAALDDAAGGKRLVAYYAGDGSEFVVEALRAHLSSALPEYMIPAAYVALESLPLLPSGKLDRKALPAPGGGSFAQRVYEAPVGEIETALASMWSELLKVERVGRNDNFFELGGHSLLAMRIANSLKAIGLRLPSIATVFQHPTLAALAAYLSTGSAGAGGAIAIRAGGTQPPLFLVHDLFGDDLYFTRLAARIDPGVPVFGLPAVPLDIPQLYSVEEIAAAKVETILARWENGPYRVAGWSFGGVIAYEIARQLTERGKTVEFLGMFDSVAPTARRSLVRKQADPLRRALRTLLLHSGEPRGPRAVAPQSDVPDDATFEELLAQYRANDALPPRLAACSDAELREMCARIAAHLQAEESYVPQPLAMPVHLFAARDTLTMAHTLVRHDAESLGWGGVVPSDALNVVTVGGDHQSITAGHAPELGRAVSEALSRCSGERLGGVEFALDHR